MSIKERVKANSCTSLDEKSTAQRIAEQHNVSKNTVKNAEKYAKAVDSVSENAGISPQQILSGVSRKDLQELSEKSRKTRSIRKLGFVYI